MASYRRKTDTTDHSPAQSLEQHHAPPTATARIATVCVRGRKPQSLSGNGKSVRLMKAIVAEVADRWRDIDVLLFPGGFVRLADYIGGRSQRDRTRLISNSEPGLSVARAVKRLQATSAGALIVTGIDSFKRSETDRGDQLCVAFNAEGVVGIGRKVFPTDWDTNGDGRTPIVCYVADYSSRHRVVQLASGARAILCSCYDAFGIAEAATGPSGRIRFIRYIADADVHEAGTHRFGALRRELFEEWRALIVTSQASMSLAAIHGFPRPGRDIFWQRHGIANASAALGGGLSIGASFFRDQLPDLTRAGWHSPLASLGVPVSHLRKAQYRPAFPHQPLDWFEVGTAKDGGPEALVRLFSTEAP